MAKRLRKRVKVGEMDRPRPCPDCRTSMLAIYQASGLGYVVLCATCERYYGRTSREVLEESGLLLKG